MTAAQYDLHNAVVRWEPISDRGEGRCVQSPDGEYVEHHDYAALSAHLEAVEKERNSRAAMVNVAYMAGYYQAECGLPEHKEPARAARDLKARAEKAEAALAVAYRMGLEAGVKVAQNRITGHGEHHEEDMECESIAYDIRSLPDKTPAEILAQIEEME